MKNLLAAIAIICLIGGVSDVNAQKFPDADASILDVSYFPENATKAAFAKTDEDKKARAKKMRVIYSRPLAKGRKIFGEGKDFLVPYGAMWRAGANESTELHLFTNVKVGGKTLKAGKRYTVHIMPTEKEWTVYFSTDLDGWGSYAFQGAPEKTTYAKVTVPTQKTSKSLEMVGIFFEETDGGANMVIGWENTMVKIPFDIK